MSPPGDGWQRVAKCGREGRKWLLHAVKEAPDEDTRMSNSTTAILLIDEAHLMSVELLEEIETDGSELSEMAQEASSTGR